MIELSGALIIRLYVSHLSSTCDMLSSVACVTSLCVQVTKAVLNLVGKLDSLIYIFDMCIRASLF